jgi:hypothetical protein
MITQVPARNSTVFNQRLLEFGCAEPASTSAVEPDRNAKLPFLNT